MNLIKHIALMLCLCAAIPAGAKDYPASLFGIKSDGVTMNKGSIQHAIDYIHQEGGGRLVFQVGRYLTGSFVIKSNVTIELKEGAVIVGSTNPYDYDVNCLVHANGAENIAIVGKGVIDGQGRELGGNYFGLYSRGLIKKIGDSPGRVEPRPFLINFSNCKSVHIEGITMKNPAFWTTAFDFCDGLVIDGVTLQSRAYWNNDGLDLCDSKHVLIQNCNIDAVDDGVCLKSAAVDGRCCEDIVVRNNVIRSSANGVKFGTASYGGFKNVRIINNVVYDTFRSAVSIQCVDGGIVENIVVDSLRAINVGNAIFMRVGERVGRRGHMENISVSNVYAEIPAGKPDLGVEFEGPTQEWNPRNVSPCGVVGMIGNMVYNVKIENVEIHFPGGANPYFAKVGLDELDKVPEMPEAYPEFNQFKELPAWGFYLRHVDGIEFNNVKLFAKEKDYRPAIIVDDVHNGTFKKVTAKSPSLKGTIYVRNNSKNIKK